MQAHKLFVFDFDGVFADTKEFYYSLIREFGPKYGVHADREFFNNCLRKDLLTSLQELGLPSHTLAEYMDAVHKEAQRRIAEITLFPYAKGFITRFSATMPLIIVSHNHNHIIWKAMEKEGLQGHISWVLGYDDHPAKAAKLAMVKQKYGQKGHFFVGDTPSDILAAKKAGMQSIGVSWGYYPKHELAAYEPHYLMDKPEELEAFISKRLKNL